MDQFIAEIKKIPPVTRFVTGSSLAVTLSVIMKAVSPYTVLFVKGYVFKKFQIWRLYTSFFLGGGGFNYIFELVMLYRTVNDLETKSYDSRSADFAWQLLWACGAIVATTLPLNTYIFTRPFLLCLVYLYSRLEPPGMMTSIMGLITVPVIYYPYILIAFDLLLEGPQAAGRSVAGAVVGHLWWWLVWSADFARQGVLSNHARAPQWFANWIGPQRGQGRPAAPPPPAAGGAAAGLARGGVHVTAPRQAQPAGSTLGHSWGTGRRLGS